MPDHVAMLRGSKQRRATDCATPFEKRLLKRVYSSTPSRNFRLQID